MSSSRSRLTPQMRAYEEKFADSGEIRWLPYLMYFHPTNYASSVVSTDASGFRYSEARGTRYAIHDVASDKRVRLLAGSSTVFGIGASADRWTLSSRLHENDDRPEPWLNFGGRSFNSAQELLLLVLYRHLLPPVEEIVLFSGFNNLGLARLPHQLRQDHGAFFNCREFFEAMGVERSRGLREAGRRWFGTAAAGPTQELSLSEQMDYAATLTLRHLATWQSIARDLGARLTYVLQPLAGWVRPQGSNEEEALFSELDALGRFTEVYGDILTTDVCDSYGNLLRRGAESMGVRFLNMSPILSANLKSDQWLFVDRIHFTDDGHDFVSKQLLDNLR